ncbi:Modification methylase Eco47II (M.Eco47II) (Cytosine-specific methyltransferase Eco47II) [Durusdinium trenchii]|uniref:Modification methylase Eco47II (M.Eco47II) (Cytosine-specific methyltransferase Eco47II) n=1 Tax=Durusdinium trenchii TaxID=1381693 RepID=A0ABP0MNQ6_9DINO
MGMPSEGEIFAGYDLEVLSEMPLVLSADSNSVFPLSPPGDRIGSAVVDLFAGSGAMGVALEALGYKVVVSVDSCYLCCDHLAKNGRGYVLRGDVCCPTTISRVHEILCNAHIKDFILVGGFPCQPFSSQGRMMEEEDPRFNAFIGLMNAARQLQPRALLIECVPNAGRNALIQSHLASLCKDLNWGFRQTTFDLKEQWPMSRNRWFCILSDERFLPVAIPHWHILTEGNTVGKVLGSFLPSSFPGIEQLWVTNRELSIYQNPAFGVDNRKLELHQVCSTILHSYGSPLDKCPCGCRGMGFAEATLVAKGLRGFFVCSPDSQAPRYLHEQELRKLFALPMHLSFPEDQKAALCFYGLMAAPLQVIWVFSNFLHTASRTACDVVPLHPQLILEEYKAQILRSYGTSHMPEGEHKIPLDINYVPGPAINCEASPDTLMATIALAERFHKDWGTSVQLTVEKLSTEPDMPLQDIAGTAIQIQRIDKKRKTPPPEGQLVLQVKQAPGQRIAIKPKGSFLFEFLDDTAVRRPAIVTDEAGLPIPLDTRLWFPQTITAVDQGTTPCFPPNIGDVHQPYIQPLFRGQGKSGHTNEGLTEYEIDTNMQDYLSLNGFEKDLYWDPRWICDVAELWPAEAYLRIQAKWQLLDSLQDCRIGIIWENSHWIAFVAHKQRQHLQVILLDGCRTPVSAHIDLFFNRVKHSLGCHSLNIAVTASITQHNGQHCGAIALLHLWATLEPCLKPTEAQAVVLFQQIINKRQPQQQQTSTLSSTLPWTLSASGPDIAQQLAKLLLQKGVPAEATLARSTQLVEANATGIAIANIEDIAGFLQDQKNISTQALGILILDQPTDDILTKRLSKIRFPALYTETNEQILVFGGLLNLGDLTISRAAHGPSSTPSTIKTTIIKFFIYRDQYRTRWEDFITAPVKDLLHNFPPLSFCSGTGCGPDCKKTHADLDDSFETILLEVWGRHWTNVQGQKKNPHEAELYTVHFRVPEAAIQELVTNNPAGVFCDPRGEEIHLPHPNFAVIWLPKVDFAAAEHKSRTCEFSLSLVRNKWRYGIRVLKKNEPKAWEILRPETTYVDIQVNSVYEIGPIPHGTQKKQIEQILKDWKWAGKVLQPGKGSPHAMSWHIGAANDPPYTVMQAFSQDILINKIKDTEPGLAPPRLFTAARTQKHLRTNHEQHTGKDPWLNKANDPWANYAASHQTTPAAAGGADTKKHYQQLTEHIQKDITAVAKKELEQQQAQASASNSNMSDTGQGKLEQLEAAMHELGNQNKALKGWLHETQVRMGHQETQLGKLQADIQHTNEQMSAQFNAMKGEINSNFDKQFRQSLSYESPVLQTGPCPALRAQHGAVRLTQISGLKSKQLSAAERIAPLWFQVNWITTIAPGDAVVEQTSTPSTLRAVAKLFQSCERFRTIVVFSTERWAAWASPAFPLFTTGARKAFQWFLNRPGLQEMRPLARAIRSPFWGSIDSNFYVLLAIRSFNRGPPMLPQAEPDTQSISIAAGEELGFDRIHHLRGNGGRQFRFAEYLRRFLEKLGHVVEIYETMEGRELVPYQCVLVRSQWEEVREPCLQLLNVQKAAYRRANGGKTSPSLILGAVKNLGWTLSSNE